MLWTQFFDSIAHSTFHSCVLMRTKRSQSPSGVESIVFAQLAFWFRGVYSSFLWSKILGLCWNHVFMLSFTISNLVPELNRQKISISIFWETTRYFLREGHVVVMFLEMGAARAESIVEVQKVDIMGIATWGTRIWNGFSGFPAAFSSRHDFVHFFSHLQKKSTFRTL